MKNILMDDLLNSKEDFCAVHLGQHSFIFKIANKVIAFDPYLTPDENRLIKPFISADELENVDIIFGSHDHGDHIDRPSLAAMAEASPDAVFVFPQAVVPSVREIPQARIVGMNDMQTVEVDGVKITGIAAAHEFLDRTADGLYPYLGFIVEYGGKTVYHSGDCCIYEGLLSKLGAWHFDLMMLPVNGRDAVRYLNNCIGNMTYQEAVDLAGSLMPEMVWPCHYDMFANNLADPDLFIAYANAKYPALKTQLPPTGKPAVFDRERIF